MAYYPILSENSDSKFIKPISQYSIKNRTETNLKRALLYLLIIFSFESLQAQDQIERLSGQVVKCKITQIDTSFIAFSTKLRGKKIETHLGIAEISSILYKDKSYDLKVLSPQELLNEISGTPTLGIELNKLRKWKQIYTGGGYLYTTKGERFFMLSISIKNQGDDNRIVDFDKFFLLDLTKKMKYSVSNVMANSVMNIFLRHQKKIKPGSQLKVKAAFICPKDFSPEILLADGRLIEVPKGISLQ